jgi:hypothetical protein
MAKPLLNYRGKEGAFFSSDHQKRSQRGVAATTKDAVSAYGRVGVSASPQARKHEWDAQWLNEDLK